ncbi:cystathionine gamma-lyase-like [Biomphalaria glabrata]|uniref:Cystathionine gamma-lyase-like n=1 Tax=Biomphalaria glabrata TaxID=6526 RepID=A0A9W3ATC6_BIOGL|nr:cystathionine gamma-lyase-like [Biomphalaria glabrata]
MSRPSIRHTPAKSNFDFSTNGLTIDDVTPNTAIVTSRLVRQGPVTEPLAVPIYHSSTYAVDKMEDITSGILDGGPIYSRLSNPTTEAAEAMINSLEKGAGSLTFSSGMAAVTSIFLGFLKKGDHVIQQIPVYPGTATALKLLRDSYGVELTTVKDVTVEEVAKFIKPNTKLLWFETPCNPDSTVVDVEELTALAKSRNILVAVDGTFGSPALQHFMPYGIDFSMHSCTKYIGGHSDLIGGVVTTRTLEQWRVLKHIQGTFGNMLSPHDASLVIRGFRTLTLRMDKISSTAMQVAIVLEGHPKVQRVHYPGLKSHPQHEIAKKQMSAYSGMIMAEIKGGEQGGRTVAESLRIVRLAVSLGGVVSLVEHPFSMTHGRYLLTPEETDEGGITPGMLRISIGLEDAVDLIKDFEQALAKVKI